MYLVITQKSNPNDRYAVLSHYRSINSFYGTTNYTEDCFRLVDDIDDFDYFYKNGSHDGGYEASSGWDEHVEVFFTRFFANLHKMSLEDDYDNITVISVKEFRKLLQKDTEE